MDEPALGTDIERRCADAVRTLAVASVTAFCASCAERFLDGYAAWTAVEQLPLPAVELVRRGIDLCWAGNGDAAEAESLTALIADALEGGPVFTSHLSVFSVALDVAGEALHSLHDPLVWRALRCSSYALGFHLKVDDLRRDLAGDFPVPDLAEFERDPGAMAEAEHQLADVELLAGGSTEVQRLRDRSAEAGRRLLESVETILRAAGS